jgi:3-dehydroquinate dehydratase-1
MDLSEKEVQILFSEPCTLVATCRPGKLTTEERLNLLSLAIQNGARYVDVEIESEASYIQKIREIARENGVKLIISWHNFELTPDPGEIEDIISKARVQGADIVKIATMARNREDSSLVLGLYSRHNDIIAFCMGEEGKITRAAAPFLGAEFTFAALDESRATAPGQLSLEAMEKIRELLETKH